MKLIWSNGKRMEVRDVGEVIFTIDAHDNSYLANHGYQILSDEAARELLTKLKGAGVCKNVKGNSTQS